MEQLDITPVQQPVVSNYRVKRMIFDTDPPCIDWTVIDNLGVTRSGSYTGAIAATLLTQINRGNFTVNSQQKVILNRLAADGHLEPGTVSGTPQ